MEAKAGDRVVVIGDREEIEGILMPGSKERVVIVKLDSGYNVGIEEKNVKNIKIIEHEEKKIKKAKEVNEKEINEEIVEGSQKQRNSEGISGSRNVEHFFESRTSGTPKSQSDFEGKGLPKVSILHTGGTIASKVDYKTGGVIPKFTPKDMLEMFPEIKEMANINSRFVKQMWSEDMRFAHYNIIAKEVYNEIKKGADAVIVTHGTDTMHYTSAALAFMFEKLNVPVVLVGAQRSSDRGSSDAAWNLLSAVTFVTQSDFAEVAICMHENMNDENCVVLPACKTRKMHSSRRDAFKAVNVLPWARVNPKKKTFEFLRKDYNKREKSSLGANVSEPKLFKEKLKVGLLKMHTNMYAEEIGFYENFDGIVAEGFGIAGNVPINETDESTKEHTKIFNTIKKMTSEGIIVFAATQTIFGRVNMNVYSTGRRMQEAGIIGNYSDMTAETAFIKLAWLLSNYPRDKVKELMNVNLRGEISSRSEAEESYLGAER